MLLPSSLPLALPNTIAQFVGTRERIYRENLQSRKTRFRTTFVPRTRVPSRDTLKPSRSERITIDKAAANRFIKHAIAQAVRAPDQSSQPTDQKPAPGPSRIHQAQPLPPGAANKMLVRAEWVKQVQKAVEEEEEDLEVFDEDEDCQNANADVEMADHKTSAPAPLPVGKGETDTSSERHFGTSLA